jgi:membrane-associated phospholipid phosphatase
MRHVRRLFPIFIVLNTLMVISTPSHGGHYVVDVVAGIAVGVLAVWISRKVFARTASSAEVSTLAVGRA